MERQNRIVDQKAIDINNLIHYTVWSKDKIAGGVSQKEAVEALSRVIDYPVELIYSIAGVHFLDEDDNEEDIKE
jgi:hypothetical protein